ncbi:MAG TPA: POTRA domain-containing protein, partial [Blastocatellia bacterium]
MNIIRLVICLPCAMLLLAAAAAQDPPPNAKWRLAAIAFEGLKSQSPDKIVAASGLQVGQTIDFESVKAAAQRLSKTGLFGKVSFRYRYTSTQIELTFELEEKTTGKKPCEFDNFVWFSDKEITDAIKRDMPDFDGSIMVSDFAADAVKKSLARLLAEKRIAGEVVYELNESLS